MKQWILSVVITCLIAFMLVGISTIGTRAEGIHTYIAVGLILMALFSFLVWTVKQLLDQILGRK